MGMGIACGEGHEVGPTVLKAAEAAAAKAVPAMNEAMSGKPADWTPQWVEFWRVHGETEAAKPLVAAYWEQRDKQRVVGTRTFNDSMSLFRSQKRAEGFKALEKLRDEGAYNYEGY